MDKLSPRKYRETAPQSDTALAVQQEFGDDAARAFLNQRGIKRELTDRVLTAPPGQRRNYGRSLGRRA